MAIDNNCDVNVPGQAPWCAPKWLAASCRETNKLIAEWSDRLSNRFSGFLDDEMENARVRVAIAAAQVAKPIPGSASIDIRRQPQTLASHDTSKFVSESLMVEQINAIASTLTWKELETRSQSIQSKAPVGHKVSAWFIRTESDSGSITEEWRVNGNMACRVEFGQLASIAVRKLGCATTENADKYWLGRVREWMQREKLDKSKDLAWLPDTGYSDFEGHRDTVREMITERIADLSAMFCTELVALGIPESVVSPPSVPTTLSTIVPPKPDTPNSEFVHSEDYCSIGYGGKQYTLTPLAGGIARVLHEACIKDGGGVSATVITHKVGCGKVWDAFRSRDGRAFFSDLIEKDAKNVYRLKIGEPSHGSTRRAEPS